jgi:hypothetical protein
VYLPAAAGIGLGNTIKYLRGAECIGLGTTIKLLWRSTSGAAGNGLFTRPSTCAAPRASA